MRKVLVLLAVVAVVVMGCSEEQSQPIATERTQAQEVVGPVGSSASLSEPLVTFWVEDDEVSVTGYTEDSANHVVSLEMVRVLPSEEVLHYTYVVERPHDEEDLTACAATLLDAQDELLFALEYQWVTDDPEPNWIEITERTPHDELVITRQIDGIRVVETYALNGETREFVYDNLDLPAMERTSPEDQPSGEESRFTLRSKAIKEFGQWEELALPENTLNYNADGEFFVQVLGNEEFVVWVEQEFPAGNNDEIMKKLCGIAGACTLLKCQYGGGIANNLCNFCAGVVLGCIITSFFGLW